MKKTQGFSLIELMIGILVGLFILSGSVLMFASYSKSSTDSIALTHLEHELRSAMNLIVGDIRRAGFYGNAAAMIQSGANNNPFMAAVTDIQTPVNTCVLLSYDRNNDGTLPALNTAGGDERFGYRLNNQVIQTRSITDAAFSCTQGSWENLTDSTVVQITNLTFTLAPANIFINGVDATGGMVTLRNVTITLTGRLLNDTAVTRTLSTNVRVRNDKFTPPS